MPYEFLPGRDYRMPPHFGPLAVSGRSDPRLTNNDVSNITLSFLTEKEQLEALLPGKRFSLFGEPVLTVSCTYQGSVGWLGGRPYNIISVNFPVAFDGKVDHAKGRFLLVAWENNCDAIISGREGRGWPKIWADLPNPRYLRDEIFISAFWYGFKFLDIHVKNVKPFTPEEIANAGKNAPKLDGTICYKYIAKTGAPGETDASYVTLDGAVGMVTPKVLEASKGEGTLQFHRAAWEDMPTQYNIVNTFADLKIKEYRSVLFTRYTGYGQGFSKILQ